MSMMVEHKFVLGLQIKQTSKGICIHQTKYMKKLMKKFSMNDAKEMKTPMHPITFYLDVRMNPVIYRDARN